jgi:preprotein translocase subunit SecA
MAAEPELYAAADTGSYNRPEEAMPMAPEPVQQQPVRVDKTPGRNDPCFCGSGKKYKLCHGR